MHSDLAIEYRQWQFSTKLIASFQEWCGCDSSTPFARSKEAETILQRWLLSIQQEDFPFDRQTPLFPHIDKYRNFNHKFCEEIFQKGFTTGIDESWRIFDKLLTSISEWRTRCYSNQFPEESSPPISKTYKRINKISMKMGDFESKFSKSLNYLWNHFPVDNIATMILRYESLGSGCYQWGFSQQVHKIFYNEFGARYEAFASPLNSSFLRMADARFCSLFPDTDGIFGSLGNFFHVDLLDYPGGWTVNPPFIEDILLRATVTVISALEKGVKSSFFFTYPCWKDSTGWLMLENSEFNVAHQDFEAKTFWIQEAYGARFQPQCKLSLFILGSLPDNSSPVETIYQAISAN